MTPPLRLAVLGVGFIANLHVRAAQEHGLTVGVVAGRDAGRTAEFATRHGIERWTLDWEAAVSDDEIDAAVIGTPNHLHHPQAMAAISAGKHVLVDKPMALDVAQAGEMAGAADTAGRTLLVGHMWRYRSEVVAIRDRVAAGGVGQPVRTRGFGIHAGWGPTGWFTDRGRSGGGALIDMGIHAIDTARFVLGDPAPVRVAASIGTSYGDYDVDDDGVVLIDWDDGVRSVVECGWWQPRLDGVEADTEIYGTAGYERIWPLFTPATPAPADYVHCSLPMYAAQLGDFATCCRTGATPVASAAVGLTALTIVEDAYRSADR
ncbi:MAG: Gfo/Idh/MocA family protein [Ilumatobacteraceae bacterium]